MMSNNLREARRGSDGNAGRRDGLFVVRVVSERPRPALAWRAIPLLVVAILVSALLVTPAIAVDPSRISATCFASNGVDPFTSSETITLYEGNRLTFRLGYRNDDSGADPVYTAHFTSTLPELGSVRPDPCHRYRRAAGGGRALDGHGP